MAKVLNVQDLRTICREAKKKGIKHTLTMQQVDDLCDQTERGNETLFVLKQVMLHGDRDPDVRCWLVWSDQEEDEPITFDVPLALFDKLPEHTEAMPEESAK